MILKNEQQDFFIHWTFRTFFAFVAFVQVDTPWGTVVSLEHSLPFVSESEILTLTFKPCKDGSEGLCEAKTSLSFVGNLEITAE